MKGFFSMFNEIPHTKNVLCNTREDRCNNFAIHYKTPVPLKREGGSTR